MESSDYTEIRQLFDEYLQMYASRDDRLTTYFSENFSGFTGGGDFLVKDRAHWVAITRQDFAQVKDPLRIELKDVSIQSLSDTIVVTTGFFKIHLPIKDHILSRETARLVLIFRKETTGWKISHSSISIPYYLVREGEVYPLQELVQRNRLLEEQVAERTRQLVEANENLKQTNEKLAKEIEEHKQAEEALRVSKEQLNVIFDTSEAGIIMVSPEGVIEFGNKRMAEMFGMSVQQLIGTNYADHLHESGKQVGAARMRQLIQGVIQSVSLERHYVSVDGTEFWGHLSGRRLENPDGTLRALVGVIADITDRKRMEKESFDRKSLMDTLLANLQVGVFMVEAPSGKPLIANEKALNLLGRGILPDINKENLTDVYDAYIYGTKERYPVEKMPIVRGMSGESSTVADMQVVRPDGTSRLLEVFGSPVLDSNGHPWASLICFQDITDRKEHEKEEIKIQKLESLGILAGGIAHDFNNILTGITGNVSLAKMFVDENHRAYSALVGAEKASARATELARQLLTFARGGEPVKRVVSLPQLVNESVSLVLHGSNVKGCVDIPDSIHAIEADEGQISQAFHNIVINATQAMPGGGSLTITARNTTLGARDITAVRPGNYACLTFTDEGCGISDADVKKIFDPYFTTKQNGTGLGLASTHSIITKHGGHISVSSKLDKGTSFTVLLPSIGETYTEHQTEAVMQSFKGEHRGFILVMDDEEMIRDLAAAMLKEIGYRVATCADGTEAIGHYKAAGESGMPFSAVIMDLTIPGGMGGKETAREILSIDPTATLIVSSGYSNDPIMSDFSTYGFTGAIAKPYRVAEMAQVLRSSLADPG